MVAAFFFFEDKSKDRYTGLDSHTVQESIRQETTASRRIISRFSLAETNLSTLSTFRTMIFQLLAVTTFGPHAGNRDCRFQPHAYLLHSNTRCIFLPFFFFFNPARFEDCAGQRAALPWHRRHPEFRRQEKVHIEVKLQQQKSAPLQALEEGLKGQASITLRQKAFFFLCH